MKVLIADDEPLARERLKRLLADVPGWKVVAEAGDGEQAWSLCAEHLPDLLILDIRMPGLDGLQLARKVESLRPPPAIIFSTAYAEHALHAFQTLATAYLLKPVTRDKLRAALDKVKSTNRAHGVQTESGPEITVRRGEVLHRIPLGRVLFLRADQKLTEVHHLEGVDLVDTSLSQLEEQYPLLLRIHRNTLVNPEHVESIDAATHALRLRHHDTPLAISRRLYSGVRHRLGVVQSA